MSRGFDGLVAVVARLRSPRGCPWDRKQTHRSLIRYLREETRELAAALRKGDWREMEDELGDILFHVVLHAQIASEGGRFDIHDVASSQARKLRRRHPHVFGRHGRLRTAADVARQWKKLKARERELRARELAARA